MVLKKTLFQRFLKNYNLFNINELCQFTQQVFHFFFIFYGNMLLWGLWNNMIDSQNKM
jgi:hypothetical protein